MRRPRLGRRATGLAAAAVFIAACLFGLKSGAPAGVRPAGDVRPAPAASSRLAAPAAGAIPAPAADRPAAADGAGRTQAFLARGWLAGTEIDGDWGLWQGGQLQPSASLRRRFDYLLSGVGEVPLADLRQWVGGEVGARRGADGAAAVLAVWDAYVTLRRDHADTAFDIDDPQSWQRALAERTRQRVAVLGPAWAYAFFADDDRETGAFVQRRLDARDAPGSAGGIAGAPADTMSLVAPPAAPLTAEQAAARNAAREAAFGAEAASRMRSVDAEWADWQQRLADARRELQGIDAEAQLSTLQRAEARQALLAGRFNGTELLRAQALLSTGR